MTLNNFPGSHLFSQHPLSLGVALPLAMSFAAAPAALAAERPPNIVVILADDVGYGDVSCYGATRVHTPNIDRIAQDGLRFTSGYCSASVCTPTRFSMLTGRYAFRQPGTGIAPPNATALIQPGTVTLASLLHDAGYATAIIGKWHLGLGSGQQPDWNGELNPGPLEIGFDYCFMFPTTNDRVPSVYVENHRVVNLDPADPITVSNTNPDGQPDGIALRDQLRMDWSHGHNNTVHNGIGRIGFMSGGKAALWRDEDLADKWVEKSTAWIAQHKDKPFLLVLTPHDVHVPRMPNERFQGATPMGYRGDAIAELDWTVGQILDELDRQGLTDNTLVIFSSDNGPVLDDGYKDGAIEMLGDHKPAGPFRGGKTTVYEGGTRVPLLVRWPGHVQPGVSDQMVCTIDLPASLGALVGTTTLPDGACPDSFNVLGALLGEPGAVGRDHLVQQDNSGKFHFGLRVGDWKLVVHHKTAKSQEAVELYNLADDPGETHDMAAEHPERVQKLNTLLNQIMAGTGTR